MEGHKSPDRVEDQGPREPRHLDPTLCLGKSPALLCTPSPGISISSQLCFDKIDTEPPPSAQAYGAVCSYAGGWGSPLGSTKDAS